MKKKMSQTKLFGIALSCAGALLAVTAAVFFGTLAIFVSLICACLGALAASAACFISSGKAKKAFDEYLSSLGLAETGYLSQIERAIAQYDIYLAERQRLTDLEAKKKLAQDALSFALGEIEQKLFSFSADKKEAPLEALDGLILELSEYFSKRKKLCGELSLAEVFATRKREELATYDRGALQKSLPDEISRENIDVSRLDEDYKRCLAQRDNIKNQLYELSLSIERIKPKIERRRELDIDVDEKELLLEKYKREHAVLDLAYSALEEANSRQKSNFAPKIRARAGEILSSLSKGRYSGVILDDEFEVSVEQHGASRAAGALSAGTADTVYLSLRLALIDSIFASDAPLFLDESLSQLDSERASDAISLLSDFVSNGNQCLLFTCHHREAEILSRAGIPFTFHQLETAT
jgi:ABC-type dipeptide/oligopeptide/nickel transport system ATPase subunit